MVAVSLANSNVSVAVSAGNVTVRHFFFPIGTGDFYSETTVGHQSYRCDFLSIFLAFQRFFLASCSRPFLGGLKLEQDSVGTKVCRFYPLLREK